MTEEPVLHKCPTCGHQATAYAFNLSKGICDVLAKIYVAQRTVVEISKLELTNSQYSNYPKLAYWGLALKAPEGTVTKGGHWFITDLGKRFLRGEASVFKRAVLLNKVLQNFDGPQVFVQDVVPGFDHKPYYARQIISSQLNLPL